MIQFVSKPPLTLFDPRMDKLFPTPLPEVASTASRLSPAWTPFFPHRIASLRKVFLSRCLPSSFIFNDSRRVPLRLSKMSSRAPMARVISRTLSSARMRAAIAGSRIDTVAYTDTGGSGLDSTTLSSTLDEASAKAVAVYRDALRGIPAMRQNFSLVESKGEIGRCVRDLFERHLEVKDPKVVDMLVFKARQEVMEIGEQWKSRCHVYGYIQRYTEKVLREEAAKKLKAGGGGKEDMLRIWRERGLVPQEVVTWGHFVRWKEEEDGKFKAFAEDNRLFDKGVLERNASAAGNGCSIM